LEQSFANAKRDCLLDVVSRGHFRVPIRFGRIFVMPGCFVVVVFGITSVIEHSDGLFCRRVSLF
jgi:hypothetical protein